jgi:hypothetical protein
MNQNHQEQAQSVYNNVAFASWSLFVDIYTALLAAFRCLDALTVNNYGARFGVTPSVNVN